MPQEVARVKDEDDADMQIPTIGERIRRLFLIRNPATGEPYTSEQVVDATGLSLGNINRMRRGTAHNPVRESLEALRSFFKVPGEYFFDTPEAVRMYEELGRLQEARSYGLRGLALRSDLLKEPERQDTAADRGGLDAITARVQALDVDALDALEELLKAVRRLQGGRDSQDDHDADAPLSP
jgi:transcriptional regulator with XRE-family HTH domain